MNIQNIVITLLLFFSDILFLSQAYAVLNGHNDRGIWLEENFRKVWGKWDLTLHLEQRWGDDYRKFWYTEYDFRARYDMTKNLDEWIGIHQKNGLVKTLSVGAGFAPIQELSSNTLGIPKRVWILRPSLEANVILSWNKWEFHHRLRSDYILFTLPHYKDRCVFRYRMILYSPWSFTSFKIRPYIFNEFFFRNNTYHRSSPSGFVGYFYEDRFRLGLISELWSENSNGEILWQWRPLKQIPGNHPGWNNTYQFGLNLNFLF